MTGATIRSGEARAFALRLRTGLAVHGFTLGRDRPVAAVRLVAGDLAGVGEAPPLASFTGFDCSATLTTLNALLPRLRGLEPGAALARLHGADAPPDPQARAALDIALHELLALARGIPVHRLLRPDVDPARAVPVSRAIGLHPPQRTLALARAYRRRGLRALKLKVGRDPRHDAELLLRVRAAVGPEIELALDANGAYDTSAALALWRHAAPAAPAYFEQPVPRGDPAALRALRRRGVTVVADESAIDAASVRALARADAVDGVAIKLIKCGGLRPALAMVDAALERGLNVSVVDPLGSAVSLAAGLQLALLLPPMRFAHGLSAGYEVDAPHAPHTPPEGGALRPPAAPGLGVAVHWPPAPSSPSTTSAPAAPERNPA